jgi:Rho-binding antiterminator
MAVNGAWRRVAMTTDYQPIACDRYSELEVLASRRATVVARFVDPGGTEGTCRGQVVDLLTRDGAEHLAVRVEGGETRLLRLDRLLEMRGVDGSPVWRQ